MTSKPYRAAQRNLSWMMLAGSCLLAACSDHVPSPDRGAPDAHVPDDAGASKPNTFATAQAQLEPVAGAVAGQFGPVQGTATWRATSSGVDFAISFFGCSGSMLFPIEILDAHDCSAASLDAPVWKDGRGAGIPSVGCTGVASGMGMLNHPRSADRKDAWTIGGPARSNLLGRILLLRDPQSMAPLACGVIERGDDLTRTPIPPADQPPSVELRAQLVGMCLVKQFVGVRPDCPDPTSLVACASEHCDLGSCIEACADYTDCLEKTEDPCQSMFQCPASTECTRCQGQMWSCTVSYCSEDISCTPPISPDGPCRKVEACCAMQGERAASCLTTVQLIETLGGDQSCLGSMNDWDVLAHMHVPCSYME